MAGHLTKDLIIEKKPKNTQNFEFLFFVQKSSSRMCASFGLKLWTIMFLYDSTKTTYLEKIWFSRY